MLLSDGEKNSNVYRDTSLSVVVNLSTGLAAACVRRVEAALIGAVINDMRATTT